MENYANLMFKGKVAQLQKSDGIFDKNIATYQRRNSTALGMEEASFIQERESFYISSIGENGWPYVQHRGGPAGFMKSLGNNRLACLDYLGNRQFITMGHLQENPRVSLIFMDYFNRRRLKLQGHGQLVALQDAPENILSHFEVKNTPAQRLLIIDVQALDWNCPKYIPCLVPVTVANEATDQYTAELQQEIAELKAQIDALK